MIDHILKDGSFSARAVTRDPESTNAKALAAKGAEVVKADLNDPASLEKAMEGAYGVFGLTDFWTAWHDEEKQGKNLVDAATKTGIKHFVWPTLDHSEWQVPHFETKARVNDYLIASGVPRTSIYTAFFVENVGSPFFALKRNESGKVVMDVLFSTDAKIPMIAASDIGGWALAAFKNPDEWAGKDMKVCTEWVSPREIAKLVSETTGEEVEVKEVDEQAWQAARGPQTEELWLNMQCFYTAPPDYRDMALTKRVLPNAKTIKEYVEERGKSIIQ